MLSYPINFKGSANATSGIKSSWEVEASGFSEKCCVPAEFEGEGGTFSPEDFFLLALENCFVATFKVYAEYSKLNYKALNIKTQLSVDKDESGKPMMSTIHFEIEIMDASDQKKATLLVNKTLESGFILRSVKTNITHELKFTITDAAL
jgi:organic hydroperoxide reductase OsmC/OhrA